MTIKDVAKLAGVSIATVSNYVNKKCPVSREKSERIAFAIEQLGYTPNQSARIMKSGFSKRIGFVLPNIQDPYYLQILEGLSHALDECGYSISLGLTKDMPELEQRAALRLMQERVCGVVIISSQPENISFFQKNFCDKKVPVTAVDRRIDMPEAGFLGFDNKRTICDITRGLLEDAKRNIVMIAGPQNFSAEKDAVSGYIQAFKDKGLAYLPCNILYTKMNKESAFRNIIRHLAVNRPEAVITTSKLITLGVMEGITVNGLRFPADVLVATLGEDSWNRHYSFQDVITTARAAMKLGEEAAKMVLTQIRQKDTPVYEIILKDKPPEKCSMPKYKNTHTTLKALMLETAQVDLFAGLLPRFRQLYGIDVKITKVRHEKLLSAVKTEKSFDVLMFDLPWLYSLFSKGLLIDITSKVSKSINKADYLENCLDIFGRCGEKYYGLPYTYAPQILFYHKDVFANRFVAEGFYKKHKLKLRPPRSFAEFNLTANFLTKSINPISPTDYGTAIPAQYKECLLPELYMRMRSYGGEIFNSKNQVVFNSPQTYKAYSNLIELIKTLPSKYLGLNDMNVVDEFLNGSLAMLITYPSFITGVNDIQRKSQLGQIGFAHIPGKAPILGGWSLGVSTFSQNKSAAFDFIKWATGADIANYSAIMAGQSAIAKTFDNNELTGLYPWLPVYKEAYDYAAPIIPPVLTDGTVISQDKIDDIIFWYLTKKMREDLSLEDTIKSTHAKLERLASKHYN